MSNSRFSPRLIAFVVLAAALGFLILRKPTVGGGAPAGRDVEISEFGADLNPSDLVLVKFGATWCGPCKFMDEELKQVDLNRLGLKVVPIDVDQRADLSGKHNVNGIPHCILVRNGKTLGEFVGAKSAQDLTHWVEDRR
jgi:thioredoxin 1/thioredoxin 2